LSNKKVRRLLRKALVKLEDFYKDYQKNFKKIYKKPNDLYLEKFGPFMQDLCAIKLITENGALENVKNREYLLAASKLAKIWASFPCNSKKSEDKSCYKNQPSQNKNFIKEICRETSDALQTNFEKILKKSKNLIKETLSKIKFERSKK